MLLRSKNCLNVHTGYVVTLLKGGLNMFSLLVSVEGHMRSSKGSVSNAMALDSQ